MDFLIRTLSFNAWGTRRTAFAGTDNEKHTNGGSQIQLEQRNYIAPYVRNLLPSSLTTKQKE